MEGTLVISSDDSYVPAGLLPKAPRAYLHMVEMLWFMSDINHRACPLLFILFFYLFLSLWPFQLYFIPYIFQTALRFLALFPQSYLCLIDPFKVSTICFL